jgi:lipid II:glycine glycyltransferase (peptidoglycan interpeptide bridge formation enzyme)
MRVVVDSRPSVSGLTVSTTDLLGPSPEWDRFVASSTGGDLVQSSAWAGFKRELGTTTYLVEVRRDDEVVGGAVVHVRRVAPGIRVALVVRGPLLRTDDAEVQDWVIHELETLAGMMSAQVLAVQAPFGHDALDRELDTRGYRLGFPALAPSATSLIDLRMTDAQLIAGAGKTRRKHLRLGREQGFTFSTEPDVALFARLYGASAARGGFVPLQLPTLEAQWRHLGPAGHLSMMFACHEGRPIAGAWLSSFGGTVTGKLVGWDNVPEQPRYVNDALNWETFQWARTVGAHTYDLGGFDRAAAEQILAGAPRPASLAKSSSANKATYGGQIVLLPAARFKVLTPVLGRSMGAFADQLLASSRASKLVARFRN